MPTFGSYTQSYNKK